MAGTQYLDLGAIQKKDGGSGTKGAQYLDLGALQKQAAAAGGGATTDVPLTTFSVSPQAPTTLRSLISNVPTL